MARKQPEIIKYLHQTSNTCLITTYFFNLSAKPFDPYTALRVTKTAKHANVFVLCVSPNLSVSLCNFLNHIALSRSFGTLRVTKMREEAI
jgi:hypothetical protein